LAIELTSIQKPWELDEILQKIANQVRALEEKRIAFTSVLHEARFDIDLCAELPLAKRNLVDRQLATKLPPINLGGLRICGIDGGLLKKSLRGIELVVTRAIATIFEYNPSGRVYAKYWPQGELPKVKANLYPISRQEAEISASLERVKEELQVAIRIQDRHPSELILIDGSILPQTTAHPSPHSMLADKYQEIRSLYFELYSKSEETGTLLAGIVKDSRSNRFMNLLGELIPHLIPRYSQLAKLQDFDYRTALKSIYDNEFFFRVLEPGERSCIFRLEEVSPPKLTARDSSQGISKKTVVGFFARTAKYDYPLRVEVLVPKHYNPKEVVTKVSAMLSSDNDTFALPSVLIEADSQARLVERDMDFIFTQLAQRIGHPPAFLKQRRERMPFH
jgi:hypothetical protein